MTSFSKSSLVKACSPTNLFPSPVGSIYQFGATPWNLALFITSQNTVYLFVIEAADYFFNLSNMLGYFEHEQNSPCSSFNRDVCIKYVEVKQSENRRGSFVESCINYKL